MFNLWGIGTELSKRVARHMGQVRSRARSANETASLAVAGHQQESANTAAEHDVHRQVTLDWLETKPGPRCLISRLCIEPLRVYQEEHTELRLQSKQSMTPVDISRTLEMGAAELKKEIPYYKIVSGDLEHDAFQRLELLLCEGVLWQDSVPDRDKNIENQNLAFREIMCEGSLLEHNIHARRRR